MAGQNHKLAIVIFPLTLVLSLLLSSHGQVTARRLLQNINPHPENPPPLSSIVSILKMETDILDDLGPIISSEQLAMLTQPIDQLSTSAQCVSSTDLKRLLDPITNKLQQLASNDDLTLSSTVIRRAVEDLQDLIHNMENLIFGLNSDVARVFNSIPKVRESVEKLAGSLGVSSHDVENLLEPFNKQLQKSTDQCVTGTNLKELVGAISKLPELPDARTLALITDSIDKIPGLVASLSAASSNPAAAADSAKLAPESTQT